MADIAAVSPTSEARSALEMRQILDNGELEEPVDQRARARVHRGPPPPLEIKRPRLSLDSAAESLDSCGSSRASGDSLHSEGGVGGGELARSKKMVDSLLQRVAKLESQRNQARDDAIKKHAWCKKVKPVVDESNKLKEKIVQLKNTISNLEKDKIGRLEEMTNLKGQFNFLDEQLQAAYKAHQDLQENQEEALQKALQKAVEEARQEARREAEDETNKLRDVEAQRLKRQLRDLKGRLENEIEPEMRTLLLEEQTFKERLDARDAVLRTTQEELLALQRRVREELEPQIVKLQEKQSKREAKLQVELEATRTELIRYQERQQRTLAAGKKLADIVRGLKLRLKKVCSERDQLRQDLATQAAEAQGRADQAQQREDEQAAESEERMRRVASDVADLEQKLDIAQEACKSLLNGKRELMLQLTELKKTHAECPRTRPGRDRSPSMPPGVPLPARLRTPLWQPDLHTSASFSYAQEDEAPEEEDESTFLTEEPREEEHEHLHFEIEQVPVIKTEPADEED